MNFFQQTRENVLEIEKHTCLSGFHAGLSAYVCYVWCYYPGPIADRAGSAVALFTSGLGTIVFHI